MSAIAIVHEVATAHGLPDSAIYGYSRRAPVVRARDEASWRVRREMGWSLPKIGRLLRRDHTTVLVAIRRHQARVDAP
jgi:chromosomal replication initiator protein